MSDNKIDNTVKISADRHKAWKLLAIHKDREMREIINKSFDLYLQHKKGVPHERDYWRLGCNCGRLVWWI